jgi:integrase
MHNTQCLAEANLVPSVGSVREARNHRWRDIRPISSKDPNVPNLSPIVKGKAGIREVAASGSLVRQALYRILEMRRKDLADETPDNMCGLDNRIM